MSNSVSDFLMYRIRQIMHFIRHINSLLLQLRSWKIWYVFCVTLLLKDCVCETSLSCLILRITCWKIQFFSSGIDFRKGAPKVRSTYTRGEPCRSVLLQTFSPPPGKDPPQEDFSWNAPEWVSKTNRNLKD